MLVTGNAADGKPMVEGTTNLPDGTELIATLSRRASGYMAQDKLTVHAGKFVSNQFSNKGAPLMPGTYVLDISGALAAVQPAGVRAALGDGYSNFSGPFIKKGKFGTVLKREASLIVPGQSNSAADAAARKVAKEDRLAWQRKSCLEIPVLAESLTHQKMDAAKREATIKSCLAEAK